jgi:hypothetical protein
MIHTTPRPTNKRAPFDWDILQLIARIAGGAIAALGLVVMAGWHLQSATVLQLRSTFAPMQYNTALSFLLCGTALLALTYSWSRLAAACSAVVTAIGLLTLSQYLLGIDIGIDQLLIKASITVQTSHPGRMAPNTAVCFILAGTALWVMSMSPRREQFFLMTGPFGSIVLDWCPSSVISLA